MSFPDKNHFLRTSEQSEYLRAKSSYISCRDAKGVVVRYNWWRICPDGAPQIYPDVDRDLLERVYRDCKVASFQADTSTDRVYYRMSTETGSSSKGNLSAPCLVLRVCGSRDATWVKLEAMQERSRFQEHEKLASYLGAVNSSLMKHIAAQFTKITPVHLDWEQQLRNVISSYRGSEYAKMNALYSQQRLLDINDANGDPNTGTNTELYLQTRLLRYMIQSSSFDRELIVYRGIRDGKGLADLPRASASQQLSSSVKMIELMPKLRPLVINNPDAVGTVLYVLSEYDSAPPEPVKRVGLRRRVYSQPELLDDLLSVLKDAGSLEYVLGLRPDAVEVMKGIGDNYVYETPERYRAQTVGDKLTFNHFVSTSYNWDVALAHKRDRRANECCNFKIIIPKGFPCLYLGAGEEEILLPPCVTYVVTDIDSTRTLITLRPVSYQKVAFDTATLERDLKNFAKTRMAGYEFPVSEAEYYLRLYKREACRETPGVSE
jgi:hypothetical protein